MRVQASYDDTLFNELDLQARRAVAASTGR
jgi:hypothetical protein